MPEIVLRLKLFAKRVTNSGSASGFAGTQSGYYSLYSGRLNTFTEPSGSLVNANPAAVAWLYLNILLIAVTLTSSGLSRRI